RSTGTWQCLGDRCQVPVYLKVVGSEPEIRRSWERDEAYKKRVVKIIPSALAAVLFIFLTSDQVSITELDKQIGWKGEMRVLPEISIIADEDPYSAIESQQRLKILKSLDLDITEGPDIDKPRLFNDEDPDQTDMPEISTDDLLNINTRLSRRDVPYSSTYMILKMVDPKYPIYELENGIEGNVTVELLVDERGLVEAASVLSSIGTKNFEESSLEAVRQFVFQPPTKNGEPISMWIKFLIKFRILE
ncbi:MAG: energy transducer TonB, partial [Candidatus Krumholzibacteria bacterium]|nr:energy transducer TonB [Candidatus Krumholzibacteria bacterium]